MSVMGGSETGRAQARPVVFLSRRISEVLAHDRTVCVLARFKEMEESRLKDRRA